MKVHVGNEMDHVGPKHVEFEINPIAVALGLIGWIWAAVLFAAWVIK